MRSITMKNAVGRDVKCTFIGLTGPARSGKDTFYELFKELYKNKTKTVVARLSIGDIIRHKVWKSIQALVAPYGWNTLEEIPKEDIRPLYAVFGNVVRQLTDGQAFTSHISKHLQTHIDNAVGDTADHVIFIITDMRFAEFEYDEPDWLRNMNGILVRLTRYWVHPMSGEKEFVQPVNDLEKVNDPRMMALADYSVCWKTTDDKEYLKSIVKQFIANIAHEDPNIDKIYAFA